LIVLVPGDTDAVNENTGDSVDDVDTVIWLAVGVDTM
jgi:hypothetical protein